MFLKTKVNNDLTIWMNNQSGALLKQVIIEINCSSNDEDEAISNITKISILMNETSLQYASIGETIRLDCLLEIVQFWRKLTTHFIVAACEGGSPVVHSTISNRIYVSDTCHILTIHNFTKEDVGIYRCFTINTKHDINITLRTLTIVEAKGYSIIQRKEGENVNLTCFMNEAKHDPIMHWRADENVLVSNRSNYVIYRFETQLTDDRKHFVCTANNSRFNHPLKAEVQLNLILKPRVAVISSPPLPTVKKGHTITLSCQEKSGKNGTIDSFFWSHDGKLLSNNSQLQFTRTKIADAGMYKCTARNRAGEDSGDIEITVTCEIFYLN
ncbi:hemicentin-1-like [Mytilus trossulus]|uniref:hemicentin-1-like n=1 Tax=Mytilus trossulus TaxID=6551 RepID=UPI003006168F